ncbi:hypothetical protein [Micromonospora sp. KC213]|uniref:hypothetical protein n=1 Tax=Micromonospora sp. KC213 TaxID=2530378 RepID=UPI0010469246|nr:hypothetical protein [Micromonospora sp. KC213]TDC31794.1 hypothetical protein E1166_27445 [Micromonospora sp. KC213]
MLVRKARTAGPLVTAPVLVAWPSRARTAIATANRERSSPPLSGAAASATARVAATCPAT